MKNTLKFLFVALAMVAMLSCGGGKTESTETTTEEATEEAAPAPDTTAVEMEEAPADSVAGN